MLGGAAAPGSTVSAVAAASTITLACVVTAGFVRWPNHCALRFRARLQGRVIKIDHLVEEFLIAGREREGLRGSRFAGREFAGRCRYKG
jgi:hypothetical protein